MMWNTEIWDGFDSSVNYVNYVNYAVWVKASITYSVD